MNLGFVGIVGILRALVSGWIWILGACTGIDEPFAVRAPEGGCLDVVGGVGAREGLELPGFFAVPGKDAAGGIEDLAKTIAILEAVVEAVEDSGTVGVWHVDGVDHVFAIRRHLAHEAEALLRVLFRE